MTRSLKNKATDTSLDKDLDDVIDQAGSIAELNFSDDYPGPSFKDLAPETEADLGKDFAETPRPAGEMTEDDLVPEILIREDGALSPREIGGDTPADQTLRVVDANSIGAGTGLDEAELAELDPLDKKIPVKHRP